MTYYRGETQYITVVQFGTASRLPSRFTVPLDYAQAVNSMRIAAMNGDFLEELAITYALELAKLPDAAVDYRLIADEARVEAEIVLFPARGALEATLRYEMTPEDRALLTGEPTEDRYAYPQPDTAND